MDAADGDRASSRGGDSRPGRRKKWLSDHLADHITSFITAQGLSPEDHSPPQRRDTEVGHQPGHTGVTRASLESRNAIGVASFEAGRFQEAAAVLEPVVEDCRQLLGEANPDTLIAAGNLAMTYIELQRSDEGLLLLAENIADRERVLGDGHPSTLAARHAQAAAYDLVDRPDEALTAFSAVVVTIRAHLADCYAELGQLDQAVAGMSRAAADCQAVVGPHHSLAVALQQDAATLRDTWVEG